MNHLTEEQFEDIKQGLLKEPEHLKGCDTCRQLLAEKKAIASRMRSAFGSVRPTEQLADNIRMQVAGKVKPVRLPFVQWLRDNHFQKIAWPAAAAVFLITAIIGIYAIKPSSAMAEFVDIHSQNLSTEHEFYSESDPEKLAEYLKDKLGFSPSMPAVGKGMAIRGCCVRHFRGRIAGSYVVDTPQGIMSIIVVTDKPETLGLKKVKNNGQVLWESSFAKCNMVAIRLGDYSYCAVGEISHEYLAELISQLVPETQPQQKALQQ